MKLDLNKVDNMQFDGIDFGDYPDFCDAFCCEADYDGIQMTDEQLDILNDDHYEFVYDSLYQHLF